MLEALGVGEGWHCLEVGGGGGSIAAWLARTVGKTGHVVATDLETGFLDAIDSPNLDVWRHDIATDPLPERAFDLIHERAVLLHLPERTQVMHRLVEALKPGGWLICEETDFATFVEGWPHDESRRVARAMVAFLERRGAEPNYGRRLFAKIRAAGLHDVGAEGRVYMMRGGHPSADLPRFTLDRIRAPIVASGAASESEFAAALALFDEPEVAVMSHVMMAAWGRRGTPSA